MIIRTLRLTLLACLASLAAAATSWADGTAQLQMEDSAVTLSDRPDAQAILNTWRTELGVDNVRIAAFWDQIERTAGVYDFSRLDQGISRIRNAGLQPMITIHEKG